MIQVAFEGVIGSGKTTLANLYARHTSSQLILETFDENPFLAKFYDNKDTWASRMQLWFAAERAKQLSAQNTMAAGNEAFVSDFSFQKEHVFGQMLLRGDELELHRTYLDLLEPTALRPKLVAMLDAKTDRLLERIQRRGRAYETAIDDKYLQEVRLAYHNYYPWDQTNMIRIDTTGLDLSSATQLKSLFSQIDRAVGRTALDHLVNQTAQEV